MLTHRRLATVDPLWRVMMAESQGSLDDREGLDAYQLLQGDGSWWVVGWDPSLSTFFAQHVRSGAAGEGEDVLRDHGVYAHEIRSVEQLERVVGRRLPEYAVQALLDDAGQQPEQDPLASLPWALRQDAMVGMEEPAQADAWQAAAARIRQRIDDQTLGPVSSLPATPVADTFERLGDAAGLSIPHRSGAQGQLVVFIATLGIEPSLVSGILDGSVEELDAEQIGQVCEGLVCSPFDLWGTLLARSALDLYPPERWPRRIEPLDSGRSPPTTLPEAKQMLREFVEAQAVRQLRDVEQVPDQPDDDAIADGTVMATAYRRVAILGCHLDGHVTQVTDEAAPVDPEADYHLAFRQVGYPVGFGDIPEDDHGATSAGWDVRPQLAVAADELRRELAASTTDLSASAIELVRFTPRARPEIWLSWDPVSETWELARDPRDLYPASPADVLDPDGWADPRPAGFVDHTPDGVPGLLLHQGASTPDLEL